MNDDESKQRRKRKLDKLNLQGLKKKNQHFSSEVMQSWMKISIMQNSLKREKM